MRVGTGWWWTLGGCVLALSGAGCSSSESGNDRGDSNAGGATGSSGGASTGGSSGGFPASGGLPASSGGAPGAAGGAPPASGGTSATAGGAANAGGASTGGTGAGGAPNSSILVPPQGILVGQYYGDGSIQETAAKLGRTLPVHLTYYAWDDDWTRNNTASDLAAGRIPLVNWEPFGATLDGMIDGSYDALLRERAQGAKALGKPFFLDLGAEMNGDWSPWSGADNGMSGAKYIEAYRHVHDVFVAEGATNVVWLWCPNVTSEPREAWNATLNYYPGDPYVDWTCVDGYNWGTSNGGGWQSFHDVFEDVYATLATKNKPIMIGEMASTEDGGDKGAWIDGMLPALKSDFPLIKGLVWFDIDKETDWRISSSPASEAAFVRLVSDPYTNP